jgi:hypothetical protein
MAQARLMHAQRTQRTTVALATRNTHSTDDVCVKRPYHEQSDRTVTVIIAACPLHLLPDGKLLLFRAHDSIQLSHWTTHNAKDCIRSALQELATCSDWTGTSDTIL